MINKPLDQLTLGDIKDLIENQVQEDKNIDYKETLPGNADGDKKEFLADVSSFANLNGGDIIFGIKEKRDERNNSTGIPEAIMGLEFNYDQEKQRLENIILDGIKPRIYVSFLPIQINEENKILIVRIPKSWNPPHLVEFQKNRKFFSRNSSGKYQLDIDEIRNAFIASESIRERINDFRSSRLNKILIDQAPVAMDNFAKLVLHLMPLESFSKTAVFDISLIGYKASNHKLVPINRRYSISRFNFDGLIRNYGSDYIQLFRNGMIESVCKINHNLETVDQSFFEKHMVQSIIAYKAALQELNINPPIVITLDYINIRGLSLLYNIRQAEAIREDVLNPGEVILKNDDSNIPKIMKPVFDAIANASGFERSLSYNDNGEWTSY